MTTTYLRDPGSIRILVEFGVRNGLTMQQMLSRSGLRQEQLADPLVEIQADQEIRVIENLHNRLGKHSLLGIQVGWEYRITTYGVWGFTLLSSKDFQEVMELALRFLPLTYAFCPITARPILGQMALLFGDPVVPEPIKPFVIQRDMAAAHRLLRSLQVDEPDIGRFLYTGAKPRLGDGDLPSDWNIAIEYGSPLNAIVFDPAYLKTPLPLANPLTSASCEQLCHALIQKRRIRQGTAAIVKMYLRAFSGQGMLDLPTLASKLHMSERALRRHLQEESTSFSRLLTELRMELADDMLNSGAFSMAQIAEALDYSDQSSFSQAYKRWHGISPSALRGKKIDLTDAPEQG